MSMITKTNSNDKYFKSQDIRVFPCSYRGYYNTATSKTLVFDPEARATTESNFTEAFHKLSPNKESYIVNWDANNGILKCVIGGYYFEIRDCDIEEFFWDNNGIMTPYYLCINTKSVQLGTSEPDESNSRETHVLSPFDEVTDYLDIKYNATDYAFTGLLVSTTEQGTANFQPFKATATTDSETTTYTYSIDNTQLPITNILDSGEGNCSLRMINNTEDSETEKINTTQASGDSSVALGKGTKATAEAAMATGDHTEAKAKGAFSGGVKTKASAEGAASLGSNTHAKAPNSLAAGSNLTADKENQVVFGQYNTKDENQAFIIANGTGTNATSNKFTVGYEGNVRALGNLEIKGSIKATGASTNNLELGTTNSNSSGSIKVYGTGASKVFSVTDSGNTTISGTASIAGNTTIAGLTEITKDTESNSTTSGALKVKGGAGISKNLNVGGAFTVGDDKPTVLGGTLTAKGNTNLGGNLTTAGVTTLNDALTVEKFTTLKAGASITGNLSVTGKITSAETTVDDADNTLITKSYVDRAKVATETHTNNTIKNIAAEAPSTAEDDDGSKGDGSYLKTITQSEGKIDATKVKFAGTVDSTNTSNAPTSQAVATYVTANLKTLWTEAKVAKVQQPDLNSTLFSLQALVLDAVYPIGSIYMQYVAPSDAVPDKCPLEDTLPESAWTLIDDDVFLRSVGNGYDNRGDSGGSADAIVVSHEHTIDSINITTTGGKHSHSVTKRGTAHDGDKDDTFRTAQSDKGGKKDITWTISSSGEHTHSFTVPSSTTNTVGDGGTGKNLPPYLYVYIWRRTQ